MRSKMRGSSRRRLNLEQRLTDDSTQMFMTTKIPELRLNLAALERPFFSHHVLGHASKASGNSPAFIWRRKRKWGDGYVPL